MSVGALEDVGQKSQDAKSLEPDLTAKTFTFWSMCVCASTSVGLCVCIDINTRARTHPWVEKVPVLTHKKQLTWFTLLWHETCSLIPSLRRLCASSFLPQTLAPQPSGNVAEAGL